MNEFMGEAWRVTVELAPSLFLGLLIAGLLKEILPVGFIRRHLSGHGPRSVANAVLVGAPMPLCSCGVVPTAIGLRRQGASDAAATGFLISTPQTGVDSILVAATFLGWPFALFKVAAAVVTGMVGGVLAGWGQRGRSGEDRSDTEPVEAAETVAGKPLARKVLDGLRYAIFDLLASIDVYILAGIVAAALISTLVPPGALESLSWTRGIAGMGLALVISMPLYVCTTSSVPIATSLIAAGMPLGTALVFLMAGPATNVATIGAVYRGLGRRILVIYLGVVAVMSIVLGLTFDWILAGASGVGAVHHHADADPLGTVAGIVLLGLLGGFLVRRGVLWIRPNARGTAAPDGGIELAVQGMTCNHCVTTVSEAVRSVDGVERVDVSLERGRILVSGSVASDDAIKRAIRDAGFVARKLDQEDS